MTTAAEVPGTPKRVNLAIASELDVLRARRVVRELAAAIGFSSTDLAIIATAVSEITANMVNYAKGGEIVFDATMRDARPGLVIIVRDQGPGIADLSLAMQDGYSTSHNLGLGLPGARRLMDEFEVVSSPGMGTTVTMTKWVR